MTFVYYKWQSLIVSRKRITCEIYTTRRNCKLYFRYRIRALFASLKLEIPIVLMAMYITMWFIIKSKYIYIYRCTLMNVKKIIIILRAVDKLVSMNHRKPCFECQKLFPFNKTTIFATVSYIEISRYWGLNID